MAAQWCGYKRERITIMQQYNKAWVGTAGTLITGLLMWADTRYNLALGPALITAIGAAATGFFVWLVPNVQKAIEKIGDEQV